MILVLPVIRDVILGLIFSIRKREDRSEVRSFYLPIAPEQPLSTPALPILSTRWHMNDKFPRPLYKSESLNLNYFLIKHSKYEIFVSYLFIVLYSNLLRYNLHTIKFTCLRRAIQWFLVHFTELGNHRKDPIL